MMNLLERNPATSKKHAPLGQGGFSLVELLVASLVSMLVVGGVMIMLNELQDVHRDSQELIDAQQSARISLEQVQRDLQQAGVGLAWLLPPLPLLVPNAGGFTIRHNGDDVTAALAADMASVNDPLTVDDVTGFAIGMNIAVYDAAGALDQVTITNIDVGNNRLMHAGTTKVYTVADGTAVAEIQTIAYSVDAQNRLIRQENGGAGQPIAGNIVAFQVTYWNDATPSVVFVPATIPQMLQIQTVQVDLTIQTENVKLNTNQRRQVTLTTQVTPRAIVLS